MVRSLLHRVTRISWLLLVLAVAGCGNDPAPPDDLIPEDTYIDLLVEFSLVKAYQNTLPADSMVTDSLNRRVLDKHEISREQFLRSHEYYQDQVDRQNELVGKAIDRLKMETVTDSTSQASQDTETQ